MKKSENHNDSGKPIFRIKKEIFVDKNFTSHIILYIKACAYSEYKREKYKNKKDHQSIPAILK